METKPTDTTIKPETTTAPDPITPTIQATFLDKFRALTQENTNAPTYTPKSFQEQFYFQKGNILWIYMSGTWVTLGVSTNTMFQTVGTTLPDATTNTNKYYYLTTTDTLYRSNGTAWIALN